jgi:transcriptional regulator GlxA family with amidase domain
MALIPQGGLRKVAILVFPGVELLDFAGPGEVFAAAGAFDLVTVGVTTEPVVSQGFVTITPQHSIGTCPRPDILVVPGGGVGNVTSSAAFMDWIRATSATAEHVLSVCNGAIILAKAGLLDGLEATTHHSALAALRRSAPTATVHEDRRYVDNGKVVTAAGVSSGIDMALHVVSRLLSPESARLAAEYMEYRWQEEGPQGP